MQTLCVRRPRSRSRETKSPDSKFIRSMSSSFKRPPTYLQGSIPGLWLVFTRTGYPRARERNIAMLRPNPSVSVTHSVLFRRF